MQIRGDTQLTGLFGWPVRHTASPAMHNAGFEALGLPWVYLPLEVRPERLADAVRGTAALGFRGFNVTIPHKQAVMPFLNEVSDEARLIGAVNTVRIDEGGACRGFNTDGKGFIRSLRTDAAYDPAGATAFIMGAGGAGRAVATQLALERAARVIVCDVDAARAASLAGSIASGMPNARVETVPHEAGAVARSLGEADLFVDATPLGMHAAEPTSVPAGALKAATFVVDLVYNPPETPLLAQAKAKGCRTLNGLGMLLFQGVEAFELWTGRDAPVDVMRRALHDAVYAKGPA
ncbi:MAG: shikimate dehydrogenase [Verrucomicrobia bacterium]|nr:shikimate dehydrogenase [Verrucomicrobiota bacterium]